MENEGSNDGATAAVHSPLSSVKHESSPSLLKELGSLSKVSFDGSDHDNDHHGHHHNIVIGGNKKTQQTSDKPLKSKQPLKKSQSEVPLSTDHARDSSLVKKFALPPTEMLIKDYSAALLKHILIHGRMYISQNYICFESKIFGIKTMEVIPFKDITILTKKSKKLKFAHGVEVTTSSHTYYFASFVSREKSFRTLTKIWRQHVPKGDNNPNDDGEEDEDDDGTQDYESDDSTLKRKAKKIEEGSLRFGRSIEEKSETIDDNEKSLRRFSAPLFSRASPNSGSKQTGPLSVSTTTLENGENITPPSPAANVTLPNPLLDSSNLNAPSETPVPTPPESEEEDEGLYDEADGFLGSEAPFQQVLTSTFQINVKTFFKIFFSDESMFSKTYHDSRSDKDLVVKQWSNSPQFGLIRDVLFLSPVKVPLGPSHTRIHETQRYHLSKNRLLIDTICMMLDIPYGDSFRVEGKWDISAVTADSCKLVVNVGVHFMKKTWFKGKIETQTIKETRESFQQWASLASAEITKYKASQPIPSASLPSSAATSPTITPIQANIPSSSVVVSPVISPVMSPITSPITTPTPATMSTTSPPPTSTSGSFRPILPTEGARSNSQGGKFSLIHDTFNTITSQSVSNIFSEQSAASIVFFLVLGFIFFNMYMKIAYLEGRVSTLETILQPLISKAKDMNES